MNLNSPYNRLRQLFATIYGWIILIAVLFSLLFAIDLVLKGTNYYTVLVALLMAIGFLIFQHPRYSYFGANLMAVCTMYLIALSLMSVFFSNLLFLYQTIISAAISLLLTLPLHFITKEKRIMMPMFESTFFGLLAYVVTTLFLTAAFGGVDIGANLFLLSVTIAFILLSLLIVINRSYREREILGIVDITNLNIYSNLYENLNKVFVKYDQQTKRVVSEFKNSIVSFIAGDFRRCIEDTYRCMEGLDRLLLWSPYPELTDSEYKKTFKQICAWRNRISHSACMHACGSI